MNYPCASTEFISFRVVLFEQRKDISHNFLRNKDLRNTKISYFII